jgi:hypothetical protein
MIFYTAQVGNSFVAGPDTREEALKHLKRLYRDSQKEQGVAEGVAETLPMDDAVKVLRQYGAGHFKTTSNELHFYKQGRPFSVDLVMNPDATRSVTLSSLNSATRGLKGQGVAEGIMSKIANKVMGAAPEQPKYKVGQRVKYETSPHQPDWADGGSGVGVITDYKNGHYMINGNPVNHFEIKGVVAEGSKTPTDWMGVPTKLAKNDKKPIKRPSGYDEYIKQGAKQGFQDDPTNPLRKKVKEQGVAEGDRPGMKDGRPYSDPLRRHPGNDSYMTPEYLIQKYQDELKKIAAGPYKRPKDVAMYQARIAKLQRQQGVAEGSSPNKTDLAMAYLMAVVNAPMGTPEKRRIINWQQILDYKFDIEIDTAALAQLLPQLDNQLQSGKLDKLQNRMISRGELSIESIQQGVAEGSVKELQLDLRVLSDEQFQTQYRMTKEQARAELRKSTVKETATDGSTSASHMSVGAVYKNKPPKMQKPGTNALDGDDLLTGGSLVKRR